MFVLGVDPGLSRCGYGCIAGDAGRERAVTAGVITTPRDSPLPERLAELYGELGEVILECKPEVVVVERVLFQTNARTAMSVGQASGIALLCAARAGLPVVEYSSNEVKLAVAGYGAASKEQVQLMVARLLNLDEVPRPPDVADALALSICHLAGAAPPLGIGALTMIGSLSGTLAAIELSGEHAVEILVEVHGVGYEVLVGAREGAALPAIGEAIALSVHTHVREGDITLYGFSDREVRRAFELLLNAHGVGPALALAILSVHTPPALARAIDEGDLDALCAVPGIGRKTAQRLTVELSSRLDVLSPTFITGSGRGEADSRGEVREALLALGYRTEEIRAVLEALPRDGAVEELLREALRELAPQR